MATFNRLYSLCSYRKTLCFVCSPIDSPFQNGKKIWEKETKSQYFLAVKELKKKSDRQLKYHYLAWMQSDICLQFKIREKIFLTMASISIWLGGARGCPVLAVVVARAARVGLTSEQQMKGTSLGW